MSPQVHHRLQPCVLGHASDGLSHAKITQHIFSAAKDGVEGNCPVIVLDVLTHAGLSDTTTTEDLDSVGSSDLGGLGSMHLQETNRSSKFRSLLLIGLENLVKLRSTFTNNGKLTMLFIW